MKPAPIWRRIAALIYDSLIIFSYLLLMTALAMLVTQRTSFLPFRSLFLSYLIISLGLFLTWFWQRDGQTLGMLAWKIKLIDKNNQKLTWKKAWLRYFYLLFSVASGIGLLWCLVDKQKQSLHDKLANTKIIC